MESKISKFSKLSETQKTSINQFWKAIKEHKPNLKESSKENLTFLKSSDNQLLICDYLINNDYSANTLSIRFNDLGVVLRNFLKMDGDMYIKYGIQYKEEYITKEKKEDHELGYKTKNFKNYDFLKARLNEFYEKEKNDKSRATHFGRLILELNLNQAPLRLELPTLDIIYNETDNNDNKKNYLLINGDDMHYIINSDKVSNKIGSKPIKLSKEVSESIKKSLERYPRTYLLTNATNNNKATKLTYSKTYLKKILFPDYPLMSQNIFRRAYASKYLKNSSKLTSEKISNDMRTSENMLRSIYNYRNADDMKEEPKEIIKVEVKKESNGKFNVNEWGKKYREENKDKLKEKNKNYYLKNKDEFLRGKILKNLNRGFVKAPSEASIKKYNLIKNEKGIWV